MAITSEDCLILLSELQDSGIDCNAYFAQVMKQSEPTIEVLQFINSHRQLEVTQFYEKLRKSYNNKRSKLYINIVRDSFEDPKDILTTLASLNLQILLFNKNVSNSTLFLKHARSKEIALCMYNYFKTMDIIPCQKLLHIIKADLKVLEYINRKDNNI